MDYKQFTGKTFVSVDIQPEYKKGFGFQPFEFGHFINENNENFSNVVLLYNGSETMAGVTEEEYKDWLYETAEITEDVLSTINFYDKGYAFFRYCMDSFLDDDVIANFVRFMYENGINDSRNMTRAMWAKYLKQYRRTDKKEAYELLRDSEDMVNIPELMEYIKQFNNILLTGGGVNECFKEVEIALKALKKPYKTLSQFIY